MVNLAIDIGATKVAWSVDGDAEPFQVILPALNDAKKEWQYILDAICNSNLGSVQNISVASAPIVDGLGVVRSWPNRPYWHGLSLSSLQGIACGNVRFVDDGYAAALGAAKYFSLQNFLHIGIGTGISGAVVIEGRPVGFQSGFGFELGHMSIHQNGLVCVCGKQGCLQAYASGRAIQRQSNQVAAMQQGAASIAKAVKVLQSQYDFAWLVLSGGFIEAHTEYYQLIEESLAGQDIQLVCSPEGCALGLVGAHLLHEVALSRV